MKEKKIVLNHSYKLNSDENGIVTLNKISEKNGQEEGFCIHPMYAMLLAIFNGKNILQKNIAFVMNLFSISEAIAYKLVLPFINNNSRLIVSYAGCNYVFPESILMISEEGVIREDLSASEFNINESFFLYHKDTTFKYNSLPDFKISHLALNDLSVSLIHAGQAKSFSEDQSICVGCLYKNIIIGHAVVVISDIYTNAYVLISLFVLPIFRKIGIGSALSKMIITPLFEDSQRVLLARLSSKHHNFKLAKTFALKNDLQMESFRIISLVVDAHKWINKTIHFIGNNDGFCKYKSFEELTNEEKIYIKEYSEKNLPPSLQPFWRLDENKKKYSVFLFDNKSNIEGWTIASYTQTNKVLHLYSTYSMPSARVYGSGMRTWNCLRLHINKLGLDDKVKNLSLDVAEDNIRAYKLFKIMTEGIPTEEIQYYKLFC